jgi:hypothetical protein
MNRQRLLRLRVLEALEQRAKQFRSREDLWPFRVPHEPLPLEPIVDEALEHGSLSRDALRSRTVLRMEWLEDADGEAHAWEAWVIVLPSGVSLYCDGDPRETRILASAKRSNPIEADRFFLELLAESRGHYFGIEMSGSAPERVRTSIGDQEFLVDVFVELFEGTAAEQSIHERLLHHRDRDREAQGRDFRREVQHWLHDVLVASPHAASRAARRRPRRLRDRQE